MTDLKARIHAFATLGEFFRDYCEYAKTGKSFSDDKHEWFDQLDAKINLAGQQNGWFIAGDEDGPGGGCPRTKIAPGIGWPTG